MDVPSGLDAETGRLAEIAVDADHVVTFTTPSPAFRTSTSRSPSPTSASPTPRSCSPSGATSLASNGTPASHKGDHGEVLVVGGGPYTGAPALTAQAALRSGADLVRVACPAVVAREIQSYSENLIMRPFDGDHLAPHHVDRLAELAADHDTLIVGPGLGNADATLDAVADLLSGLRGRPSSTLTPCQSSRTRNGRGPRLHAPPIEQPGMGDVEARRRRVAWTSGVLQRRSADSASRPVRHRLRR